MVNQYCVCLRDEESWRICLFHFPVAKELWRVVLDSWVMLWVYRTTVMDLIQEWDEARVARRRRKLWILIPLCLIWLIWRECNPSLCFIKGCVGLLTCLGFFFVIPHFFVQGWHPLDASSIKF